MFVILVKAENLVEMKAQVDGTLAFLSLFMKLDLQGLK